MHFRMQIEKVPLERFRAAIKIVVTEGSSDQETCLHFNHQIFCADVRRIKPEPAIYEYALKIIKVPASEVLFIDDRDANLEQARAARIQVIRFQSVNQLRDDLEARGFPILPVRTDSHRNS